jgi:predicted nuclease of restriction endonuclease-like (RecB) superfamily
MKTRKFDRMAKYRTTTTDYAKLLADIKSRIRTAQVKAALAINNELISLYWNIGRAIVQRQKDQRWGKSVVERLAADLHAEFPHTTGFSRQNIWYMRSFYLAWTHDSQILQQPVGEMISVRKPRQPGAETPPDPLAGIPWGHNIVLLEKLKDPTIRLWYARHTIANGWSRAMLVHWIESALHKRQGGAITNFKSALPAPQSDLAQQIIKDPYNFNFLTLAPDVAERDLELALVDQITRFLIELGAGFAFVGRQVPLEVDGQDFSLDLLFYHLHLRCFIVIDLKVGDFKPEFAGKMNFYLSAVDDQMRKELDAPSIGLILCKTRSKVIAEYALRHLARPVGVARYETKLTETLPSKLAKQLPSVKQIEAGLSHPRRRARKQGRK